MTYAYRGFWTEIRPVFDEQRLKVLYWHYKIFSFRSTEFLFDGYDEDCASALHTAQAHIELLARDAAAEFKAA